MHKVSDLELIVFLMLSLFLIKTVYTVYWKFLKFVNFTFSCNLFLYSYSLQ